jgi:DNA-binding NarL/FixJ family response regulator
VGSPRKTELTARQRDIARLYCIGYSLQEIGKELFITQDTANTHLRTIRRFWNANADARMTRREFYALCQDEGIIPR